MSHWPTPSEGPHTLKREENEGQKGKCFVMQHIYQRPFYQHSKEEGHVRELIQHQAAGKGKFRHKS